MGELKHKIEADLKRAMLAGDKTLVTTLRGLKSVILYAEVAAGSRETGLDDQTVTSLLQKEAKKRQESADLYRQGGSEEKAAAELAEKAVIEQYLPAQLDEAAVRQLVTEIIGRLGATSPAQMGQVIGAAKQAAGGAADGAVIARLAKELLS
jgi:uncharacterized protein YqeY